jgi:hypothetical protein
LDFEAGFSAGKTMKNLAYKATTFFLALSMSTTILSGCSSKQQTEEDTYSMSELLTWNEEGIYSGTLQANEEDGVVFDDFSQSDFILEQEEEEELVEVQDASFTIEKVDEQTISYTLSTSADTGVYYLVSSNPVIDSDKYLTVSFAISTPQITWDVQASGAYRGSDKLVLDLSLDGAALAQEISTDMFTLPEFEGLKASVKRIDDQNVSLSLSNVPSDLNTQILAIGISADAVDSKFAKESSISVPYAQPEVEVSSDTIEINEKEKTITFNALSLPEGITGEENGLSVSDKDYSIQSQGWDKANNAYTLTLLSKNGLDEEELQNVNVTAKMKTGDEEFTYDFHPFASQSAAIAVDVDYDDDITITLRAVNGNFDENLDENDISVVTGSELSDVTFVSADENEIVYRTSIDEDAQISSYVQFDVRIHDILDSHESSATAYICTLDESRDIDGGSILTSLLGGLGKGVGTAIANALLPEVYKAIGIKNTDMRLDECTAALKALSTQMEAFKRSLSSLQTQLETSTFLNNLTTMQQYESSLWICTTEYMNASPVINYVSYLNNPDSYTQEQIDDLETSFVAYFDSQKKDMTDYMSKVNTFGSYIQYGALGATEGMVSQFFKAMENQYLVESQIYQGERGFLNRIAIIYLTNAGIVYNYAKLKGSTMTAASFESQIESITEILNKYDNKLNVANRMINNNGVDILLPTYQCVSRKMATADLSTVDVISKDLDSRKSVICAGALELSYDTMEILQQRAAKLNNSIANLLSAAGFRNINCSSGKTGGTTYVYLPHDVEFKYESKSGWGASTSTISYYSDVYVQEGENAIQTRSNVLLGQRTNVVSSVGPIVSWSKEYNVVIAFKEDSNTWVTQFLA